MPLTISNNSAVASASYYLDKNQKALQHSIKKLASGKRIISPNDDPGTLSVVMKLNAAVNRMAGAKNNVQNGISFVEIQDGMLETVGRIVGRMAELKGMATQDPLKSSQDVESYNNEFADLQKQLRDINKSTFNGVSLFADYAGTKESVTSDKTKFKGDDQADNVIEIFTSSEGSSGTKVSLYRSALLSALTISGNAASIANSAKLQKLVLVLVTEVPSAYSQEMMDRPSPSMKPDYPWVYSNRRLPISPTCVHRLVEVCPGSTLQPNRSLLWRQICVPLSVESRMWISHRKVPTSPSTQS